MKKVGPLFLGVSFVGLLFTFLLSSYSLPLASGIVRISDTFFGGVRAYCITCADLGYRVALFIDGGTPNAWHQRARIAFLKGDFTQARDMIDKQIEIHGDKFMAAYYIRGLIEGYAGNFPNAEENFKIFLEWDERNWAVHNDLAWVYFSQGRYHDAYHIADDGLQYNPNNPWLLNARGISAFNLGDLQQAKVDIELAVMEAKKLTQADWMRAYPGNDPNMAAYGLEEMRSSFEENKSLVYKKIAEDGVTLYSTE